MNHPTVKRILSLSLSAVMAASAFAGAAVIAADTKVDAAAAADYKLASGIQEGTILHCFDWKYNDIKAELPRIAAAGFTSVQTSPAQKPANTGTWYWLYQPLGFKASENDLGTPAELKSLCEEAHKYGMKVVVDVVANHLTSDQKIIDDNVRGRAFFHNESQEIKNYKDRFEITHYDLGMPDLNSENTDLQNIVKDYVLELKDMGVDGIRWDAAKHIGLPSEECDFWKVVTDTGLYNYGEILGSPVDTGDGLTLLNEYISYMSVTDNTCGNTMRDSFKSGKAPSKAANWILEGVSADKLVYWGESHDTYANKENSESNGVSQNIVDRAYAVAAARQGSTALYLSRPFVTKPGEMMIGAKGSMQFTSAEVAAVNHFHNAAGSAEDAYGVSDNNSVVTRKGVGAVIVCGSGSDKTVTVDNVNGLAPAGKYKDEVTGNEFTVTASKITGKVGSSGIAVVYASDFASRVEASVVTDTEFKDTLSVTLKALDVKDVSYKTSEGASGSFKNGDKITIGSKTKEGIITLTLTATSSAGKTVSAEYNYNKIYVKPMPKLSKGGVIFDNSSIGWKNVYVYIYDEVTFGKNNTITNAKWPGVAMTAAGDDLYTYELPDAFKECKNIMVIFNNNAGNQFPGAMEAGLTVGYDQVKYFRGAGKFELVTYETEKEATGIKLDKSSATVGVGESVTLKATVSPSDATNKTVTWKSSSASVAAVSGGKVTAKKAGTATITAETANGKKATFKITVKNAPSKVTMNKTSLTLGVKETFTLKATLPANTFSSVKTWSTSNKSVATVSGGKVTAKKAGTATITFKTFNNKKATCKIIVKKAPTSVKLNKTKLTLGVKETFSLKATLSSGSASNVKSWTTSNKNVAAVSSSGKVTAKKAGTATITFKTFNNKKATCKITVKKAPSKVTMSKKSATLKVGKKLTLKAKLPSGTASNTIKWTTSNKKVATVDSNGKVTAKKAGTVTITVKTFNGKSAKCKITVRKK